MRIDTRNPVALTMAALGFLLLAGGLTAYFGFKPPTVAKATAKPINDTIKNKIAAGRSATTAEAKLNDAKTRLWSETDDKIAPEALKSLSALATRHTLKMTTFRPQKETPAGALSILPFFVSVEGPFPAVAAFIKDAELDEPKLVLTMVQIAASDQTSHNVTASIGVAAYIDPNRTVADASKASAMTATNSPSGKATKVSQTDAAQATEHHAPAAPKA